MEAIATSKGQIVIPSSIRRRFEIRKGTKIQIEVDEEAHRILLRPVTREYIHSLRGKYKGKGLMRALMAEKKMEQEL